MANPHDGYPPSQYWNLSQESIDAIAKQVIEGLLAASKERKAKKPRKAKGDGYTEAFEAVWSKYPSRPGNNKREAFACFNQRLSENVSADHLYEKTLAYKAHCDSAEKTGTDYVLLGRTFFGCNYKFNDNWPVIEKKKADEPWAKIPFENNDLEAFCKLHGYRMAGAGKSYAEWRRAIKLEIDQKINATPLGQVTEGGNEK